MDPLVPVHGTSSIHVSRVGDVRIHFSQLLTYDYEDTTPDRSYHHKAVSEPGFIDRERRVLASNMQGFMDEEINMVNGQRARPAVQHAWVRFKTTPSRPTFTWLVEWSGREANAGETQVYLARVSPAVLEYDVHSTYVFPPGTVIERVDSTLPWQNEPPHVITYEGRKGARVGTTEAIAWHWGG